MNPLEEFFSFKHVSCVTPRNRRVIPKGLRLYFKDPNNSYNFVVIFTPSATAWIPLANLL